MSLKKMITKEIETKFPKVYKSKNDKISNFYIWFYSKNFWSILLIYNALILIIALYSKYIDFEFLKILDIKFAFWPFVKGRELEIVISSTYLL